mgnify:CR=1 FL=1
MSQYEFEGNNEGDWDDSEDLAWNESDWQIFLRNSDKEIARFLAAYNKVKDQDDRLDAAASLMGWHRDDWSSTDEIELEDNDFPIIKSLDIDDLNNISKKWKVPNTVKYELCKK